MSSRQNFPAWVIGSITSGRLLGEPFSEVHRAIEWAAGHPVWTHELPAVSKRLAPRLLQLFPSLPQRGFVEDWKEIRRSLDALFPSGIAIQKGTDRRSRDPISTLSDAIKSKRSVGP